MINPDQITNFNRSIPELQEFLLFSIAAAGKDGWLTAKALHRFVDSVRRSTRSRLTPFRCIEYCNNVLGRGTDDGASLAIRLKSCGFGCYNQRARSFSEVVAKDFNLRECTLDDLEEVNGISFKTSRLFVLHSRAEQEIIPIDRHMLDYAWKQPQIRDWAEQAAFKMPASMPVTSWLNWTNYRNLELLLVDWAEELRVTCAEFDLWVWTHGRKERHYTNVRHIRQIMRKFGERKGKKQFAALT